MAKVIMLIGRICSGKTTYARRIETEEQAVRLSCDELMQTVFPEPLGDRYDMYARRCIHYLYHLGRQLVLDGVSVVMDMGCWTRGDRREAAAFFRDVEVDWRYLDVPREEWQRRIACRNRAVAEGRANLDEYYIDEGLLAKADALFEPPAQEEGLTLTVISQ
ncbi:MAG: ATP-binding protein [Clostridiales bacterium]|nr:ATP-binding protein [Clostridiales bacterium]